jgi:hypothetical protein
MAGAYYTAIVFFQDRGPVKYHNIRECKQAVFMNFIRKNFSGNKPAAANFYSKETKLFNFQLKF